jgi:methylamine---corrinoid protein Co-methyltransferase
MPDNGRLERLLRMLDRAYSGDECTVEQWDMQAIPTRAAEILAAHRLKKTCDRDNPVNTDDVLADRFYAAGLEMAQRMGMLCVDTERVIRVSDEEIAGALARHPGEVCLGTGKDMVVRRRRRPEDGRRPMITAIIGTPVSEDIYVDLTAAIAAIPEVDSISGCTLVTAYGRPVIGGTPWETVAGKLEARLKAEATQRAGRPGMPLSATETSPTAYGVLGSLCVPDGFDSKRDVVALFSLTELKTTFEEFQRAVHGVQCGATLRGGQPAMIGGYAGGPEAAVIANIALTILQYTIFGIMYGCGNAVDVRYQGNCGRAGMWAQSVINQSISRNSPCLADAVAFQVAGPNTEMLLWESAVGCLTCGVSGASGSMVPYSAGGTRVDYLTPLETRFCAELTIAGAKMTRRQVNEIARTLIPRYEDRLFHPPHGQSIRECYDLASMEPKEDWLALHDRVRGELVAMGVPFDGPRG